MKVFYSWQSDLPPRTNWSFIEDALKKAAKAIAKQDLGIEPVIDRDTQDVTGSPDIAQTIFDKICTADVFVADVSVINGPPNEGGRPTPNPNVLVELGYAAAVLSWERVIPVNNLAFGRVEELPFDIRGRRVIKYSLSLDASDEERSKAKQALSGLLTHRLREIHTQVQKKAAEAAQKNISVNWFSKGQKENTIELLEMPDLTDFSYEFAPFTAEELSYLSEHEPADAEKALSYNHEVEKALANTDLYNQWLRWNRYARRERAISCGVCVGVHFAEARDILVTLQFPEQVEIFDPYKKVEDMQAPALPKFPKLASLAKSTIPALYDSGTITMKPLSPTIFTPLTRLCQIESEHKASIQITRLAQRREQRIDGKDCFLIAACGAVGEYTVHWQADAATLARPIEGTLKLVIKPDPGTSHRRPWISRYIGPPLEGEIVPNASDTIESRKLEASPIIAKESTWVTSGTHKRLLHEHFDSWLSKQYQSVTSINSEASENILKLNYLGTDTSGVITGIRIRFLTRMETSRSRLIHEIKRLDQLTAQQLIPSKVGKVLLALAMVDPDSGSRVHRIIGEALNDGTLALEYIRLLVIDLVNMNLEVRKFA